MVRDPAEIAMSDVAVDVARLRNDVDCVFGGLLDDVSTTFDAVLLAAAECRGLRKRAAEVASHGEAVVRASEAAVGCGTAVDHELLGVLLRHLQTQTCSKAEQAEIETVAALDKLAVILQANDFIQQRTDHVIAALASAPSDEVLALQAVQLRECAAFIRDVGDTLVSASRELNRHLAQMESVFADETAAMLLVVDAIRPIIVDGERGLLDAIVNEGAAESVSGMAHLAAGALAFLEVEIAEAREVVRRLLGAGAREVPTTESLEVLAEASRRLGWLAGRIDRDVVLSDIAGSRDVLAGFETGYTTQQERAVHAAFIAGSRSPLLDRPVYTPFELTAHGAEDLGRIDEADA